MRNPSCRARAGLVLAAFALLLPTSSWASPPPDIPMPVDLLPTLLAMALLAMAGVSLGLLRARRRPGRLALGAAVVGAAGLAGGALWVDAPIDTPFWSVSLQLEAAVLVGATLAAWVWGEGPDRGDGPRWGTAVLVVAGVLAVGLWTAAIARSVTVPLLFLHERPRECAAPPSRPLPPELQGSDRWFDWRVASRSMGDGSEEVIAAAESRSGVDLVRFRQEGQSVTLLAERRVAVDGVWIGLAADRRGHAFAAWAAPGRQRVTIARIGWDLQFLDVRSWPAGPRRGSLELSAGEVACLSHTFWRAGENRQRVLTVDASLRPRRRLYAIVSALRGGQALPGWIALSSSLIVAGWILLLALRLRGLRRAARWQGRVADDAVTLETADGQLVRVSPPPSPARGWIVGQTCTVVGRCLGEPAGGPYRQAALSVRARRVLPGPWATAVLELRGHQSRARLLAAAVIAVLAVSAIELLVLG